MFESYFVIKKHVMKEMMSGMVKDAVKTAIKGSPASNARPSLNQQSFIKVGS